LTEALCVNTMLQVLNLTLTGINSLAHGTSALFEALCKNQGLHTLILNTNNISDGGKLANILLTNTTLTKLNENCNDIQEDGFGVIAGRAGALAQPRVRLDHAAQPQQLPCLPFARRQPAPAALLALDPPLWIIAPCYKALLSLFFPSLGPS